MQRHSPGQLREQFKISEMADGHDDAGGRRGEMGQEQLLDAHDKKVRLQLLNAHGGRLDGTGEIFTNAFEILERQLADFPSWLFRPKTHGQILDGHTPVPGINQINQPAQEPAQPPENAHGQRLKHLDQAAGKQIKQLVLDSN